MSVINWNNHVSCAWQQGANGHGGILKEPRAPPWAELRIQAGKNHTRMVVPGSVLVSG